MNVKDWYCEEDDLIVVLENDEVYRLKNLYWSSFTIHGLDHTMSESVTLVGNNKVWSKT